LSKETTCEEIEKVKTSNKYAAFIFSHTTTKMFNFYQELHKRIANGHKDVKYLENLKNFTFYHAKPECSTHFYPDKKIEFK